MATGVSLDTAPGVRCERVLRPIARAGLYVPAGTAPLPSTALMLAVPARLAGCADVVLCTPPRADGRADPVVLHAAAACGVRTAFKVGGAQAIAAMAFGTATVPRCDKVFGPGNAPKCWSSPTPARGRRSSPPTCWRRPSTRPTRR
jgi:histidinol dehydrogenase